MTILWLNLFIVYILSFCARYFSKPALSTIPTIKPNKFLFFFVIVSFITVSGLRRNIGDTYFYRHSYEFLDFDLSNFEFKGDFGFFILQSLLHHLSDDAQILVFTTALITNLLIMLVLYKYSRMIELSVFVYITGGLFTVTMNGIRQTLAAAIIFAGIKYLLNGDWKKFFLIVLLASTFHQTALIMIPIYFIVRREAWTKVTFLLLAAGVGIAAEFDTFSSILFSAIEDTRFSEYSGSTEGGTNILRVAVNFAPILVAFLGREKLRALWPKSDYIVNLSTLGLVFMVIATGNWIFARFDIYFGLYSLLLISWIIKLFEQRQKMFVYFGLAFCYLFYFYFDHVVTLNLQYRSDYLNW